MTKLGKNKPPTKKAHTLIDEVGSIDDVPDEDPEGLKDDAEWDGGEDDDSAAVEEDGEEKDYEEHGDEKDDF